MTQTDLYSRLNSMAEGALTVEKIDFPSTPPTPTPTKYPSDSPGAWREQVAKCATLQGYWEWVKDQADLRSKEKFRMTVT